jgi:hypothetical protein
VNTLHGRAGHDSKVVPEQDAEAIVGEQRLRYVAAALESLHQDPVTGLAVRGEFDEPAGAILSLWQCRSAEAEPRSGEALEPPLANVVEASPPLVQPRPLLTLEQGPIGHVIGDAGRAPRLRPLAARDVGLRAVCGL